MSDFSHSVDMKCLICGESIHLGMNHYEYAKYKACVSNKAVMAKSFNDLLSSEKLFLLTGICPECQESLGNKHEESNRFWKGVCA